MFKWPGAQPPGDRGTATGVLVDSFQQVWTDSSKDSFIIHKPDSDPTTGGPGHSHRGTGAQPPGHSHRGTATGGAGGFFSASLNRLKQRKLNNTKNLTVTRGTTTGGPGHNHQRGAGHSHRGTATGRPAKTRIQQTPRPTKTY